MKTKERKNSERRQKRKGIRRARKKIETERVEAEVDKEAENRKEQERKRKLEETEKKETETDMAEEWKAQKELLDVVNGQIKRPYDGDPMGLQTFVTGVEIAKDFATTDALKRKLVTYVMGRLDGRARELISDEIETIEELMDTLKGKIRPENSKVIEARMASLHYSFKRQEDFANRAEELADALRRTLIIEGMTAEKANECVIDRTIQLCKKNTQSNVVKAVLSAATFETAKEVVAKLITSNDEVVKEDRMAWY